MTSSDIVELIVYKDEENNIFISSYWGQIFPVRKSDLNAYYDSHIGGRFMMYHEISNQLIDFIKKSPSHEQ